MGGQITLWEGNVPARIPASANSPEAILPYANSRQLTTKDRSQIISAFDGGSFEMVSNFVWNKAISSLKVQLSTLGTGFIAEMLGRVDISEDASVAQVLTDYEALRLAYELGALTSTGFFRLRQAFERIVHFGQLDPEEAGEIEMTQDEAVGVIRACVENVLGQHKIDVAVDFKRFRDELESQVFDSDSGEISHLLASPYFFKRASIRISLALIKSGTGAQLENVLGNFNLIGPLLWPELAPQERFQIGRAYSETVADGRSQAASGMRKMLLKVKGFDYVPEDLRSRSFLTAAEKVLEAHEGMNNYYKEPIPTRALADMGSVIPRPAFPLCMTAILCVKLGNFYGICYDAQTPANSVLERLPPERWLFYLDKCLRTDERVLEKLNADKPFSRWVRLVGDFDLITIVKDSKDRDVRQLIEESKDASKPIRARQVVSRLLRKFGYGTD